MISLSKSHSNRTLDEWLYYLENLHNREIDMGLERVTQVYQALSIDLSFATVITVAGTNGKGTTCAFLENALLSKGLSVSVYSSPHIHRFNERLRSNNENCTDELFIKAFEKIEACRGNISLSYYEYTTLAALLIVEAVKPDFILLEVGLGGRLDATNIVDADIAIITTVDLDHQAFLGNDRESIGFEKAGIMREQQRVIVGDANPPTSVVKHAKTLNTQCFYRNEHFKVSQNIETKIGGTSTWSWSYKNTHFTHLPVPNVPQDNIATALMALTVADMAFSTNEISALIATTKVPGRTEMVEDKCKVMLDVGHNPLAARYLASQLVSQSPRKVLAVVGMLADKDISNTLAPLIPYVNDWYCATLDVHRGAKADELYNVLNHHEGVHALTFDNVVDAYKMALTHADEHDLILVFGSFFTVSHIKAFLL